MADTNHSTTFLRIANLNIGISFSHGLSAAILPSALARFVTPPDTTATPAMNFRIANIAREPDFAVMTTAIDDTTSDMGRITLWQTSSGRYLLRLIDFAGATHSMTASPRFTDVTAALDPGSPICSAALNSLLRIAFSQMAILHGAVSIHASAIVASGRAILFLGPSGTGKSTHARLWTQTIPSTWLLNDDNPIIRIPGPGADITVPTAYGSPWSGKTPCHLPLSAPLSAIVRLSQDRENTFTPLSDTDAFTCILPSCSAIKTSPDLHNALCDTVATLAETITVGHLRCTPHPDAAITCRNSIAGAGATI